jgi:uncharacterized membrane protein YphA (DoxX/SURF4 family)
MKTIKIFSRIILGVVFIFSGFVKAVDPLGSAYRFSDYFTAFKLGFLEFLALPLAILLSAFELVLGVVIILGYRRKIVYMVLMWFMLFFTLLTGILAIFNPVSDCGCFGDALILTNWQTFLKNLVLMGFVGILYFQRKEEPEGGRPVGEWLVIGFVYLGVIFFSLWNYRHLPLLDFRPFDVGTVIQKEMEIPEGAAGDLYETTLTYRNRSTGKAELFTMDDYPRDTTRWEFITSDSKLVKKGFEPPIHDFAIMDAFGTDLADQILSDPGYSLLMICHDLGKAKESELLRAREWSRMEILADDFSFYAVTASTSALVDEKVAALQLGYSFLAGDEIMLKTMIRSNPGFMLIGDGTILGKWGFRDFPSLESVDPKALELIGNAETHMDEESQMLMEAGIYEGFSFNVLDFGSLLPALLYEKSAARMERRVVVGFIMGIVIVLLLSGYVSPLRK